MIIIIIIIIIIIGPLHRCRRKVHLRRVCSIDAVQTGDARHAQITQSFATFTGHTRRACAMPSSPNTILCY